MKTQNSTKAPVLRNGIRLEEYKSPVANTENELETLMYIKENPETCFSECIITFYEQRNSLEQKKTT